MTAFGAFVGNSTNDLRALEHWLDRPVDQVLTFLDQSSWRAFDDSIPYVTKLWENADRPVVWSVPLTTNGTSLEAVATGAYNAHFTAAAKAIAASQHGDGPIYVRVGWEFNGDWMPWAAAGHERAFIDAFRDAAGAFRAVSDRFQIVWDVNVGGGNMDPAHAYPGDAYVDVVGADLYYNTAWDSTDPQAAFAYSVSRDYGLGWQQAFAAAHGKPTAISEWGVQSDGAGPFIQNMKGWFAQHDMRFANYWDANEGGFAGLLHANQYPGAATSFLDAFGVASPDAQTLTLRVSADSYRGDPQFVVLVDGQQVGGIQTAHASHAAGQSDTIALTGTFPADPSKVEIRFLNDDWGGRADLDRNLYVEHLTIAGRDYAGDAAVNPVGSNAGGSAQLASNGSVTFDTSAGAKSGTLQLKVSADSYAGDPQFVVFVDGQQVGGVQTAHAAHAAGGFDVVTLKGNFADPPDSVRVQFLNDGWGGRADLDRNLYVEELTVNGRAFAGDSASVNTAGMNVGGIAQMMTNGVVTFDTGSKAAAGVLQLKVSGDSFQGDPQFVVTVDGQQVGGVQTTHASHAAGQSDTLTFQGDFANPRAVAIQFLNDGWGGRADLDRNLYVEDVTVNGTHLAGDTAVNDAGHNAHGVAGLYVDGTATYYFV